MAINDLLEGIGEGFLWVGEEDSIWSPNHSYNIFLNDASFLEALPIKKEILDKEKIYRISWNNGIIKIDTRFENWPPPQFSNLMKMANNRLYEDNKDKEIKPFIIPYNKKSRGYDNTNPQKHLLVIKTKFGPYVPLYEGDGQIHSVGGKEYFHIKEMALDKFFTLNNYPRVLALPNSKETKRAALIMATEIGVPNLKHLMRY